MYVAGSQITAADFLSRLELTLKEKVQLKLRDDILTSPIEVNLQSSDVADEEQLFFLPDEEEESEQEIFARKALSDQRALEDHEKDLSTKVIKNVKNHSIPQFTRSVQPRKMQGSETSNMRILSLKH